MVKTAHLIARMSQRGIDQSLIEVTCLFGRRDHRNRILMNMKEIDEQLSYVDRLKQVLLRARKKGGVIVVEEHGILITTYARGRKNKGHRRGK